MSDLDPTIIFVIAAVLAIIDHSMNLIEKSLKIVEFMTSRVKHLSRFGTWTRIKRVTCLSESLCHTLTTFMELHLFKKTLIPQLALSLSR